MTFQANILALIFVENRSMSQRSGNSFGSTETGSNIKKTSFQWVTHMTEGFLNPHYVERKGEKNIDLRKRHWLPSVWALTGD